MIKEKVKVLIPIVMGIFIKGITKMGKKMEMEYINGKMEINIKGNGKMI